MKSLIRPADRGNPIDEVAGKTVTSDAPSQLSVKQMRDAMEATRAHIDTVEHELRRANSAATRQARVSEQEAIEFQKSLLALATLEKDIAARISAENTAASRAAEELRRVRRQCASLEQLSSYGIYERWRRRLDSRLCAGGIVERTNDVSEFITFQCGYAPPEQMQQESMQEEHAKACHGELVEELRECRKHVIELRGDLFRAMPERTRLRQEVASHRRNAEHVWQHHLSRLPSFSSEIEQEKQAEVYVQLLRNELHETRREEGALHAENQRVDDEFRQSHSFFESQESTIHRFFNYAESYEKEKAQLEQRVPLSVDEAERVAQIRNASRNLKEVRRIWDTYNNESIAARQTEQQAASERQKYASRIGRAQDELNDAERHLELLTKQRASALNSLADCDKERQEMLRLHTALALELERDKSSLASLSKAFDHGNRKDKVASRNCSQATLAEDFRGRPVSSQCRDVGAGISRDAMQGYTASPYLGHRRPV